MTVESERALLTDFLEGCHGIMRAAGAMGFLHKSSRKVLALAATVIGPGIILNAVRQSEPAETYAYSDAFLNSYDAESVAAFGYEHIIAHDSEAFYATTGDTTDYFYRLADRIGSETELFSTCFEFGTIGDEFFDTILSPKYTVDENRNHWYPTDNATSAEIVRQNYLELFNPTETEWREKAVEDFTAATLGVLNAKLK